MDQKLTNHSEYSLPEPLVRQTSADLGESSSSPPSFFQNPFTPVTAPQPHAYIAAESMATPVNWMGTNIFNNLAQGPNNPPRPSINPFSGDVIPLKVTPMFDDRVKAIILTQLSVGLGSINNTIALTPLLDCFRSHFENNWNQCNNLPHMEQQVLDSIQKALESAIQQGTMLHPYRPTLEQAEGLKGLKGLSTTGLSTTDIQDAFSTLMQGNWDQPTDWATEDLLALVGTNEITLQTETPNATLKIPLQIIFQAIDTDPMFGWSQGRKKASELALALIGYTPEQPLFSRRPGPNSLGDASKDELRLPFRGTAINSADTRPEGFALSNSR